MSNATVKRFEQMDLLRVLGIVGVICIHVTDASLLLGKPTGIDRIVVLWVNQASRFAVPLFLFISGFALSYVYSQREWPGYARFIYARIKVLAPAYLFWSLMLLLYLGEKNPLDVLPVALLLGSADFHLYFIPLIIQLYLLFPVMKSVLSRGKLIYPVLFLLFLLNLALNVFYGYSGLGGELRVWFFSWWFFFFAGCVAGSKAERLLGYINKAPKALLPLGVFFFIAASAICLRTYQKYYELGTPYKNAATALKTSVFMFSCLAIPFFMFLSAGMSRQMNNKNRLKLVIMDFANCSFDIYLAHTLVMRFFLNHNWFYPKTIASTASLTIICLIGSYLLVNVLSLIPLFPSKANARRLVEGLISVAG